MITTLALSQGDPNGIGPEILLKSLASEHFPAHIRAIVCGSQAVFQYYADKLGVECLPTVHTVEQIHTSTGHIILNTEASDSHAAAVVPGQIDARAGESAMNAIRLGVYLCQQGYADALCTAPISKESIFKAGYLYPGHTEYLAYLTGCSQYTMMLVSDVLRVGLLTTHIALQRVPSAITEQAIWDKLQIISDALVNDFGIHSPRIAVFGLNPHAGDGGVLGDEETRVIAPALEIARERGILCDGPFPADGWFGNREYVRYDAVLAMYHDQGLAPFKAISFGKGVNFTAGLPIIRTSPDHGTAFGIAGKGVASNESMLEAIQLADLLTRTKKGLS